MPNARPICFAIGSPGLLAAAPLTALSEKTYKRALPLTDALRLGNDFRLIASQRVE
jgi:hypothetical protein